MARLSTHVLDTARGTPAAGLIVDLHRYESGARKHLNTVETNPDGRTDQPLISGDRLIPGVYELTFHAGAYFRALETPITEPPFLDEVVVRFGISEPEGNYHVPLLLAPHGYTTYRGS